MKKSLIALALVSAFAVPAFADEPTPEHTLTGNLTVANSYRFRGIDQTFGKPTLQGGFDYSHASGLYVGNWNSNVSQYAGYPDGNLEMDFYGGYKTTVGPVALDVGGLYYYYPGTTGTKGKVDNFELYAGATWEFLTFKVSHALTNYFDVSRTHGTNYYDLTANYDLGDGYGLVGHIGRTDVKHLNDLDYTDYKLGVTKDVGGYLFGLAYVTTNAKRGSYTWSDTNNHSIYAGKGTAVLSVTKTF